MKLLSRIRTFLFGTPWVEPPAENNLLAKLYEDIPRNPLKIDRHFFRLTLDHDHCGMCGADFEDSIHFAPAPNDPWTDIDRK